MHGSARLLRWFRGSPSRSEDRAPASEAPLRAELFSITQLERHAEKLARTHKVAARSGVPSALLRAIERAGLALGRKIDGEERFTSADVSLVRQGLRLLDAGLPINDLLALAAEYNVAARAVAERAVEMFDRHIRDPIREHAADEAEAADKLVAAFRELLPAVTALVSHHFRRVLLAVAEEHIERVGGEAEIAATRAESRRLREA